MRLGIVTILLVILTASWLAVSGNFTFHAVNHQIHHEKLQEAIALTNQIETHSYQKFKKQALQQSDLYIKSIEGNFLDAGMVVNRDLHTNAFVDYCDSLIFSSLYMTALTKLGYKKFAKKRWQNILQSTNGIYWLRHPKCFSSLSRDQLTGLMVALSQKPTRSKQTLENTIEMIRSHDGYFSDGPFYLSFLSPGLGYLIKKLSIQAGIDESLFHQTIARSFSSMEVDIVLVSRGYEAHLAGLSLFIELELDQVGNARSPRLAWMAQKLYELDTENLFFKYLFLRANGYLSQGTRSLMLQQLLAMKQFPKDRLPTACDRGADYLWQRSSDDWTPELDHCRYFYNGIDFLWMAGLLTEEK